MRIFLSYRREDASAWAGRLNDALARRFGEANIFQDVVAVLPAQQKVHAAQIVDIYQNQRSNAYVHVEPADVAVGFFQEPRRFGRPVRRSMPI